MWLCFPFLLCAYQETHFPVSNWHSLLHNVSNWLIRYQRWSSLCKCSLNNSYRAVREREKGHFGNQLARPLTMNNWSELIKICHDYPSPPQQINRATPVFAVSSLILSFLPLLLTQDMFQLTACCHTVRREEWRFDAVAASYRQLGFQQQAEFSLFRVHSQARSSWIGLIKRSVCIQKTVSPYCSPCPWWKIQLIYALTVIPNIRPWLADIAAKRCFPCSRLGHPQTAVDSNATAIANSILSDTWHHLKIPCYLNQPVPARCAFAHQITHMHTHTHTKRALSALRSLLTSLNLQSPTKDGT